MKYLLLLLSLNAFAVEQKVDKPIVVAIIDTGFNFNGVDKPKLCKFGHKNFTKDVGSTRVPGIVDPIPVDNYEPNHGTNIAGLIQKNAGKANFCMVILKYMDPNHEVDTLVSTIQAIKYATNIKVDFINYSNTGKIPDYKEKAAIDAFIKQGGKFVASAGNKNEDLYKKPLYPAAYDSNMIVVGSVEWNEIKAPYSNYGIKVTRWENGTDQIGFGVKLSGTSQAAAIATGKLVREMGHK